MAVPTLRPIGVLSWVTFRGSLSGARGIGLMVAAFLPAIVAAGLVAGGFSGGTLVGGYEALLLNLFFPLVLLLITLLLAVPLFRDEIDRESLSYLLTRTLSKPRLLLGKYLGYVGAALVVLLPPMVVSYAIVALAGSPPAGSLNGVLPALVLATVLGILAFGAIFLLMGLLTRNAILFGLFYAFIWEYLIGGLSGLAPDLSVMHFLLSIPTFYVSEGPLAGYSTSLTLAQAVIVPLLVAASALVLATLAFLEVGFVSGGP